MEIGITLFIIMCFVLYFLSKTNNPESKGLKAVRGIIIIICIIFFAVCALIFGEIAYSQGNPKKFDLKKENELMKKFGYATEYNPVITNYLYIQTGTKCSIDKLINKYDGNQNFTLFFDFIRSVNKKKGTDKTEITSSNISFYKSSIPNNGIIKIQALGKTGTLNVIEIQPLTLNGEQHYTSIIIEEGRPIGAATWSQYSFHFVVSHITTSFGMLKK